MPSCESHVPDDETGESGSESPVELNPPDECHRLMTTALQLVAKV